ncbi:Voltage-gated Ion Channel (VIC) Superfamily [Phytophthora infestans T30-4]|uniref:Voltage-gated Ion Channel (VIC) Superfamily n=1 Tax=Phytophthora infestans (strain T30-4) TaxID=403677 RepID=D0NYU3_PHYIT|nr:Voltage-gated Ion Channel (VIC) Superfamily [Phytophthora infestans T30-4]EEY68726.1 Voltage-gated Ion Channel (VIC) Superfamily [Phytophthora infestans T30-4]|eukprot:XP_002997418.1 Voltage-gated Ion Channel (VIC) Superfamily [Phytophthora infestans T30-4]
MHTSHRMLRELSSLVHRQLQLTNSRNKSRNLSENSAPMGFNMFTNGPPLGTLGGLEALRLVPPEMPQAINTARRIMKIVQLSKMKAEKSSLSDDDDILRRFSVSSMNLTKSSVAVRKRKNNIFNEKQGNASVSPEEILNARNLEGKVQPYTLHHNSRHRLVWDMIVMAIIVLDLVFTPLSLGFNYDSKFLDFYNILEPVIFTIDFFVRMFSSYVNDHGDLVSGPRRTATNYLMSGWAIPDFLSWFPFGLLTKFSHSDALGFTKIIRLAKVSHLAYRLHSAKKVGLLRFLLLLALVLTIAHLLTCYWSFVAVEWRAHLEDGAFVPKTMFEEYSLCWSLVIGCVNASPPVMYSPMELISVACFMIIGNILQASVFGAVAALISSIDENEAAYSKKIVATSERCRFLGIPDDLARRIRGYYENLWRETKSVSGDADAFINELSPALICEVKFQLYRDMIRRIPFLSAKTLAPAVIEVLILHLRTVIYMQDDVLIRKGEFGDWMGFIGSKGTVGVLDPNSEICKILCILRKGDYFGEMALLQHTKRSATTVALTWVQIHVLCRQDLDYVKEMYPTQAEILESEITLYKKMTSATERW